MDVEVGWHAAVDLVEKGAELHRAVALAAGADHGAGLDVQRGEQVRGAVTDIVMGVTLHLTRAHRLHRRGSFGGLDLRLFVDTQHQRPVGRVHIQPDNVAHLLDKQRVARQLEGLAAMRLEPKRMPDPHHR